ncbi:MAG: hypothetical protein JWO36_2079 [Myxococcales bacterium]|nr:hypothetical protein [Myxococcales bacterium]
MNARNVSGGLLAIGLAALIWLSVRDRAHPVDPHSASTVTSSAPRSASDPATSSPPQHVTKLANAEERQRVADRIARAQAARAAVRAPDRPSLPPSDPGDNRDLDHASKPVHDALEEAIPFLAACYDKSSPHTMAVVSMTLTGDPDIGTLIDSDQMLDQDGKSLPRALDECLRGTLSSLELPPLRDSDKMKVQYSFNFGDRK